MCPNSCLLSRSTDKQVSPKSGTLKSPPKGFDTSAISKTYYNLVMNIILNFKDSVCFYLCLYLCLVPFNICLLSYLKVIS